MANEGVKQTPLFVIHSGIDFEDDFYVEADVDVQRSKWRLLQVSGYSIMRYFIVVVFLVIR